MNIEQIYRLKNNNPKGIRLKGHGECCTDTDNFVRISPRFGYKQFRRKLVCLARLGQNSSISNPGNMDCNLVDCPARQKKWQWLIGAGRKILSQSNVRILEYVSRHEFGLKTPATLVIDPLTRQLPIRMLISTAQEYRDQVQFSGRRVGE